MSADLVSETVKDLDDVLLEDARVIYDDKRKEIETSVSI